MILFLASREHVLQLRYPETSSFVFGGISFSLTGSQPLCLSFLKKTVPLYPGMTMAVLDHISLSVYGMDDGFEKAKMFRWKNSFNIGGSIEDDLYVMDRRVLPGCIRIDNEKISVHEDGTLGRNGRRVTASCDYCPDDLFTFASIRFSILGEWIILQKGAAIHCRLEPGLPAAASDYPAPEVKAVIPSVRNVSFSRTLVIPLEEPLAINDLMMNPLAFQMGPALTMALASCAAGLLTVQQAMDSGRNILQVMPSLLLPLTMLVSTLLWHPLQRLYEKHQQKKRMNHRCEQYLAYLSSLHQEIMSFEDAYARRSEEHFLMGNNPGFPPFQKMPCHHDWMLVCVGRGMESFDLQFQQLFRFRHGDALAFKTRALQNQCREREDTPILLSLPDHPEIVISEEGDSDSLLKTILLQYCWYFSIESAAVAVIADLPWLNRHRWLYEVPHSMVDGIRLIAANDANARRVRDRILAHREKQFLLVRTVEYGIDVKADHVTLIRLEDNGLEHGRRSASLRITMNHNSGILREAERERAFTLNGISTDPWLWMTRLKPFVPTSAKAGQETFLDLFPDLNLQKMRRNAALLSAPIGWNSEGERMVLDLSEDGHGPHGLIAGMTGSGKSEALLTIILSLMVTHAPQDLQFVLIDFKGGGLVQMLEKDGTRAGHIACTLNNLQTGEMERALAGLAEECRYREESFQKLSRLSQQPVFHLRMYRKLAAAYGMEVLPYLVVVVDEFAQLKKEHPEFLRELMALARTGRSLGLHLLLATQKPGGIIDEQIQSNCRFRICLKVQNRGDSMEVLSKPDAADLQRPGEFYFLCDQQLQRGKAAYASAPYGNLPKEVLILDEQMNVRNTLRQGNESQSVQSMHVLEKILEEDDGFHPRSLWKQPPSSVALSDLDRPSFGIGVLDDIVHCRLPWYCLKKEGTLVQSLDLSVRRKMLRSVIVVISRDAAKEDVIVQLGIDEDDRNSLSFCGHDFMAVGFEEVERMEWMIEIVRSNRSRFFWLIVNEAGRFLEDERMRSCFMELIRREADHCAVIIFTDTIEAVPHTIACRMPERITFCRKDREQAIRMIGGSVDRMPEHPDALVRIGEAGMVCRFALSEEIGKLNSGKCLLPWIPDAILAEERKSDILLGYSLGTMEKVFWNKNQRLLVLACYEEELINVKELFRHPCFLFLSFPEFERRKHNDSALLDLPVLFVGEGFQEQFVFRIQRHRSLRNNEGILFQGTRKEVIRLVNGPCTSGVSVGGQVARMPSG